MTQRLNYTTIAPVGVKALGGVYAYITQSNLSAQLVNQVYLRVSQINGCAYCVDLHGRDLRAAGEANAVRQRARSNPPRALFPVALARLPVDGDRVAVTLRMAVMTGWAPGS